MNYHPLTSDMSLLPVSKEVWALVDCDSFFASCEVLKNPQLRGKPVCVCRGGDIILAATYEAKRMGIYTGMPSREAKKRFGDKLIFAETDFGRYGRISQRVFDVLKKYCNIFEEYSIDEGFMCVTGQANYTAIDFENWAQLVQQEVWNDVGIPISIGVAPTRLLAKMFASINKPRGIFVALSDSDITTAISSFHITKIPFLGERRAARLELGDKTIGDFCSASMNYIKQKMGMHGIKLWYELHCINALSFAPLKKPTMILRRRSFHPAFTYDKTVLWGYLMANFHRAYEQLVCVGAKAKYIKVSLRTKQFESHSQSIRLPESTSDKKKILEIVQQLFDRGYRRGFAYRTTGIGFAELDYHSNKLVSLFDPINNKSRRQLAAEQHIIALNKKFGRTLVVSGSNISLLEREKKKPKQEFGLVMGEVG